LRSVEEVESKIRGAFIFYKGGMRRKSGVDHCIFIQLLKRVSHSFFLGTNKEGLIYINDSRGESLLFSKLTKEGGRRIRVYEFGDFSGPSPF